MNVEALEIHLQRERTHAATSFALDEALGTYHGISWSDLVILQSLDEAGTAMACLELARQLCLPRSQLLKRLLPLEKTGLAARTWTESGLRASVLSDAGRMKLREARETAASVCASRHLGSRG